MTRVLVRAKPRWFKGLGRLMAPWRMRPVAAVINSKKSYAKLVKSGEPSQWWWTQWPAAVATALWLLLLVKSCR